MKKRMSSTRTNLEEIVRGYYVKDEEDFAPNYLITAVSYTHLRAHET